MKDAFFAAFHSVPRKISRRHLCKPERIVTNPMIECGNLPAFMPEFAATTFYNSNKVSRVIILQITGAKYPISIVSAKFLKI